MDIKELDHLAKQNALMPKCLALHEQAYYITSRGLYQQYASGVIDLAQAREEKAQAIKAYEEEKWQHELYMKLFEVEDKLRKLKDEGFNSVIEWEVLELIEKLFK